MTNIFFTWGRFDQLTNSGTFWLGDVLTVIPILYRLVPHVDKAPLPLRIWRLVTSNFLQVENPTHPTAHAPERASVYILGQFRTPKREMNMYWKLWRFAVLSFRYKAFQILLLLVISILIIFSMWFILMWTFDGVCPNSASGSTLA